MSAIEAKVTIDLDDFQDPTQLVNQIREIISSFNGRDTMVNVVEVDDPLSTSPIAQRGKF